jgi:hypothetical protein
MVEINGGVNIRAISADRPTDIGAIADFQNRSQLGWPEKARFGNHPVP